MTRAELTEKIIDIKRKKKLKWAEIAKKTGLSKEYVTTALLGQMPLPMANAKKAGKALGLTATEVAMLTEVPYRGCLPEAVPTDPTIYRFYEILQVYGTSIKALIHEEFGDGIMSAIDYKMDIVREKDPAGDRVIVTLNGKFLPYKTY